MRLPPAGGARHVKLAACVEFIHTATLLHDDVVDESQLRRGLASANAVFGNKASVLVGDFLFARAFQLMVEDGSLRGARHPVARGGDDRRGRGAAARHAERPRDDRGALSRRDPRQDGRAVRGGLPGRRGGRRPRRSGRSRRSPDTGINLGIAFQLVDDALDYAADQAQLGKTVGDDFREGKITLPVLPAYAAGDAAERAFWERTIGESEQHDDDLEHAMRLMARCDAIRATLDRALGFAESAKSALGCFPDSALRRALLDVADYTVSRGH